MTDKPKFWIVEHAPVTVAILFCAGLFLRVASAGWDPLWSDEAITFEFAKASWDGLVMRLLYDASPPGSYLLFKLWQTFSVAPFEVRYLSALAGALTIPATYLLGQKLFNRRIGLFAAFLLTVNPFHFYYSQEIRYPAILALVCTLQIWTFFGLTEKMNWPGAALFAVLTVAAGWMQYFFYFILLVQILWFIQNRKKFVGSFYKICVALVASFFAVLPTFAIFFMQFKAGKADREIVPVFKAIWLLFAFPVVGGSEFHLPALKFFDGINPINGGANYLWGLLLVMAPLIIFFLLGIVVERKGKERQFRGAFVVFGTVSLFLVVSRFIPMFRPKYVLPLLPLILVLVSAGVLSRELKLYLPRAVIGGGILIIIFFIGLLNQHTDPYCKRTDWAKTAGMIEYFEKKGDAILIPNKYHSLGFEFAYGGSLPVISYAADTPHLLAVSPNLLLRKVNRLEKEYNRFWVIEHKTNLFDPKNEMSKMAKNRWIKITESKVKIPLRDVAMTLYATNEQSRVESFIDRVDFYGDTFLEVQIGDGFLEGTEEGYRWMGKEAYALFNLNKGQDLAFGCFFVHRPFFGDSNPLAKLVVNGFPVAEKLIEKSDLYCLEGVIPENEREKEILKVGIVFDISFVPDSIFKDGDLLEKTALVEKLGISYSSNAMVLP